MNPAFDERDRIQAAMDRILSGTAEHSNGALTIVSLAEEAQVPRNALTQRHLDLKNEFYERVIRRGRDQGPPLLQLGSHRPRRPPPRESSAADPPQPQHPANSLTTAARIRAADRAGQSRWIKVAGGGVLPVGQGPGRTRRAPGSSLYLLVPLGHPRHARACLPRRRTRGRAHPPRTRCPHSAHLQRDPAPVHHSRRPTRPRHSPPTRLVKLAAPPPGPIPGQPLPATSHSAMKITIYGWSQHR